MEETKNNLYAKLNVVRLELSKEMNKSGKNTYSKYDYFQLKDFMPRAIELCNENGLFTKFWIDKEKQELPSKTTTTYINNDEGEIVEEVITKEENFTYTEYANLLVIDVETGEEDLFKKETANVSLQAAQPIQNLGGKSTYMKRYMYMDVFEINENDAVEEQTGKPVVAETKPVAAAKPAVKKVETKPAVTKVETKPVEPVVEVKEEPVVESKVEPTIEASVEVVSEELMSMDTKVMIAGEIKKAGLDPRGEIVEFAKALGTDVPLLKESDKDKILKMLEEKVGGNK